MLRFVLLRVLLAIPSLFGLLVMTFVLIRVVPADPATALAGDQATPAQIAEIRRQYGLDRPLYEQFIIYVQQVARLDFGESAYSPAGSTCSATRCGTSSCRQSRCRSAGSPPSRGSPAPACWRRCSAISSPMSARKDSPSAR